MPSVIFTMLIILGVAAAVIAVVVMGMEGTGREKHPEIADAMARTARHLNGEGQPPRGLLLLFDEMDDVSAADFDPRTLPGKLKSSLATVRSGASARSAPSANAPETSPRAASDVARASRGSSVSDAVGAAPASAPAPEAAPAPDAALGAADVSPADAPDVPVVPDDVWARPAGSGSTEPAPRHDDFTRALAEPAADLGADDPYGVYGRPGPGLSSRPLAEGSGGEDATVVRLDLPHRPPGH